MSEPTYRITTECDRVAMNPWEARAVRLTDGEPVAYACGSSEPEVLAIVQSILGKSTLAPGSVYFADEDGKLLDQQPPEPQSIRA